MPAYAATVTLDQRNAVDLAYGGFKLLSGQVNLTNYNTALAAITGITGQFAGTAIRVIADGVSSLGYLVRWSKADKAFKAYYPTKAITPAGTNTVTVNGGAAGTAIGIDADAAQFNLTKAATTARTSTLPVVFAGAAVAAQAATEVANDVNVGTIDFIAFGV